MQAFPIKIKNNPGGEDYRCLIPDARYEKVRDDGVIRSRAVLMAIGIDRELRRRVVPVPKIDIESVVIRSCRT